MFNLRIITGSFKARAGSRFHYFLKYLILFVLMGLFLYSCADMENTARRYLFDQFVEEEDKSGEEAKYTIEEWLEDNKIWTRQIGSTEGDEVKGVTVGSSGDVYIAGYSKGNFDGFTNTPMDGGGSASDDAYLVKYNSLGTKQWTRQLSTSTSEEFIAVAGDSSGNIFVAGQIGGGASLDGETAGGGNDLFVIKYNSSGTKLWGHQLGANGEQVTYDTTTDSSGNVYIVGTSQCPAPTFWSS